MDTSHLLPTLNAEFHLSLLCDTSILVGYSCCVGIFGNEDVLPLVMCVESDCVKNDAMLITGRLFVICANVTADLAWKS